MRVRNQDEALREAVQKPRGIIGRNIRPAAYAEDHSPSLPSASIGFSFIVPQFPSAYKHGLRGNRTLFQDRRARRDGRESGELAKWPGLSGEMGQHWHYTTRAKQAIMGEKSWERG
ncbi:hypothetical protein CE91St45_02410 [Oscillospiraceae bacterium]|nr:hypothetical protein CE91St45_02410 [Oscillospiraceae bacterium]